MGATELTALLWRERELLDLVIFKLTEEQLLLTGGHSRWLPHATAEVEAAMKLLRAAGLAVAVEVAAVAQEWGVQGDPTLADLAAAAPEPWAEILRSHRTALNAQTIQAKNVRDTNENFLRAASRSTQETLAALRPETGTYDSHGVAGSAASPSASLFDTQL